VYTPAEAGLSVSVPLVATVPLQFPDAVQSMALLDAHVSVVEVPATIDVLPKLRLGVAGALVLAAVTVSVAVVGFEVPLALEQVSV
jgi:hypothetical protein